MAAGRLQEAIDLWQQGQPEAAAEVSRQLFADDALDADGSIFFAGLLLHLRRFEEARTVLEKANQHYPDHASILSNLSIARRNCGQVLAAVDSAEQALALAPESLAAWNALLLALISAGRESRARELLPEALRLHPGASTLQHLRSQLAQGADTDSVADNEALAKKLVEQAWKSMASGARGQAETLFRQAIGIDPENASGQAGLGELLLSAGRSEEAVGFLAAALRMRPSEQRTRHLHAVASGTSPPVAPAGYVRNLFDEMAANFDTHLRDRLAYRIPEEMAAHLTQGGDDGLGEVLDLGCGTGLVGECLADHAEAIDGVDLSAEMMFKARAKGRYRNLYLSEMGQFLDEADGNWQTITAADVFVYHGKLDELFVKVDRILAAGGCFCFSVESTSGDGFDVDKRSGRYRHSRAYLTRTLRAANLLDTRFIETTIRNESGQPIAGWIVLARRDL